jgi:glycosyltransferase involved in cell wall biosynthesis
MEKMGSKFQKTELQVKFGIGSNQIMISSPLVSICIPTYEGADYLSLALDCVCAQTYRNLEVIFSDDGSKDQTLEIIRRFEDTSPFPVKVLHHRHTTLAGNWNNCVAHASGKYIKFLFQDDVIKTDCVAKLVASAETDGSISLVFSPRDILFEQTDTESAHARKIADTCGILHGGWTNLRPLQDGSELLADPALIDGVWNKFGEPSIVLIRRQSLIDIGGFDPELSQLIDLDMWYRLCYAGKVAFIDESLSSFRVHAEQLSVKNALTGDASRDTFRFVRKVINSSYFDVLCPETRGKFERLLLKPSKPKTPSKIKVFRKRLKKEVKNLFGK